VIDGKIYRGDSHWGAEFGHVAVATEPICSCGGRGCVTQLASITATLNRYERSAGEPVASFPELLERRARGDGHATQALAASLDRLTDAVRVLVNTLNPSIFLLGGGMAQWGDALAEEVTSKLKGTTFAGLDETPVRTAQLGLYSGAVGAAGLVTPGAQA
jgi:predicted NBD/HSP70 family sugar kinase